jgi:O-antigen ligase
LAVPAPAQSRIDNHVIKGLALACAVLMFFRIQSQIANSTVLVNVNVADIVVAVGLSIIVLSVAARRLPTLFPRSMSFAIAGLTIAVGSGLLVSYTRHDMGNWAYYTRGVGWLMMIGYASLGAAYARLSDERGRLLMLKGLIVVVVTISLLQLGLFAYSKFYRIPAYVVGPHLGGYANNPNAFSFDLATTLLLLIAARLLGLFERRRLLYWATVTVVAIAIYFTASRTGAAFVVLVAVFDFLLSAVPVIRASRVFRRTTIAIAVVLAIVASSFVGSQLHSQTTTAPDADVSWTDFKGYSPSATLLDRITAFQQSDLERWESDVAALGYWLKNPVLGAGIGAYYESLLRQPAPPQGIHSTFLWFLGEMGTVGFVALLFALSVIGVRAVSMMREPRQRPWGVLLLGCLMLIAVGGLAQDFFYQRIFWFVLGLAMAAGMTRSQEPMADRVYLGSTILFGLLLVAITV